MARVPALGGQELRRYINENAGSISVDEMSSRTGVSRSHIINTAIAMGVSVELKERIEKREKLRALIASQKDTLSYTQIARECNTSATNVRNTALSMGIVLPLVRVRREKETAQQTQFFNEHLRENWLV